ncbi:MAG: DUF58 domain-containing protein [Chloroflexi bacterium]|nr:DUF58 domain-containing protein [Chloroflexota bacterium]
MKPSAPSSDTNLAGGDARASPENVLLRLDWKVVRRLDGLLQGDYRTLFHGFGLDLAELREYQFNDDVRYIDWNVTARLQTPYVRQYLEDREVTAWFLLDLSPSVDFGTVRTLKRNLLIDFVGVLARLLTRHGNRVGAICYGGSVERIVPAGGGKPQVLRLLKEVMDRPRLNRAPPTNLTELLATALRMIRRRSLVFVISDFISSPGWSQPLKMLGQRHETLAVRLYDPREVELPDIGVLIMEDAETGQQLYVDTRDKGFRKRFSEAAVRREYELNVAFRRAGVDAAAISTEGDLVKEILRLASARKQRRMASASFHVPAGRN